MVIGVAVVTAVVAGVSLGRNDCQVVATALVMAADAVALRRAASQSTANNSLKGPGDAPASASPVNHWLPEPMVPADLEFVEWLPAPVVTTEFVTQQLWAEKVLGLEPCAAPTRQLTYRV